MEIKKTKQTRSTDIKNVMPGSVFKHYDHIYLLVNRPEGAWINVSEVASKVAIRLNDDTLCVFSQDAQVQLVDYSFKVWL